MGAVVTTVLVIAIVVIMIVVLTLMREVVITRGEIYALSQVIIRPPDPSILGEPLPVALAKHLPGLRRGSKTAIDRRFILFLSDDCGACRDLAKDVASLIDTTRPEVVPGTFTAVVRGPARPGGTVIARHLSPSIVDIVRDETGDLFDACDIWGTPTVALLQGPELIVADAAAGPGISWISERLQVSEPRDDSAQVMIHATN